MGVEDSDANSGKLSGGESNWWRLPGLLNRPKVLLADEPTGNLDERTGEEVMDLLLQACSEEDASLVLVTHNLSFARATNQQVFLTEGKLNRV